MKRRLSEQELAWKQRGTGQYQQLAQRCMNTMVECSPLAEVEAGRLRMEDTGIRPKGQATA